MLQQFHGGRALARVPNKTPLQEIHSLRTELIRCRQEWWIPLCDVVHDCPLVVEVSPRAAARRHLKDDAAQRPNVDRSEMSGVFAFDHFGRHVHGRTSHGLIRLGAGKVLYEGAALPGNELGGTEVYVLDDSVMIKKDIYWDLLVNKNLQKQPEDNQKRSRLTLWFDVAMGNFQVMQIHETLQQLKRIYHDDLLVLDTAVLK